MFVDLENSKKRKRGERIFGFHTFGDPGCPADFFGAFRDNIRAFLQEYAEREDYDVEGMPLWSIMLQEDSLASRITVFIIEESMQNSLHPHCDQCRCIGWSHHFVSSSRYHFIIPCPDLDDRAFGLEGLDRGKVCTSCHIPVPSSQMNCEICFLPAVQASVLDLQTHLLHGVIHTNGFGHLLCINGREKGSKYAFGRDIMDLWDRICAMLRARKVSVEDVAKKRSMELRLLHSVAYGESWFGRWGYKFGHSSFGVSQQMYTKAIEAIRGMPLAVMAQHFEEVDQKVIGIVTIYQRISAQILQTVGDLIRFMVELKARLPLHPNPSSFNNSQAASIKPLPSSSKHQYNNYYIKAAPNYTPITADLPCRWSVKRLELATQVIVEALKKCEKKWMPRQDVRDAARVFIGDTGLLDFVLKSLGNRVVGGHVVRRAVNPVSKVLEYSLEDADKTLTNPYMETQTLALTNPNVETQTITLDSSAAFSSAITSPYVPTADSICDLSRSQVTKDILYLYKNVLENYKPAGKLGTKAVITAIPTATRIILDTKQFIKDHRGETTRKGANNEFGIDDDEMLRVLCTMALSSDHNPDDSRHNIIMRPLPPPDLVVVPPHSTIGDLKKQAQKAFRDTYYIMQSFRVESIPDLQGDDEDLLFGAIESGSTVIVQGSGIDLSSDLLYEGGSDNWTVDCPCGAKDDDGERMIACDMCEVWQHTRCGGISDLDAIPHLFLCSRCRPGLFHT